MFPGFNFSEYTDFSLSFNSKLFKDNNLLNPPSWVHPVGLFSSGDNGDGWMRGTKSQLYSPGSKVPQNLPFFKKNWIFYNIASFCSFVLMFWLFGPQDRIFGHKIILATCRISAHQPGTEPTPPALEGEVLTTGQPGKSLPFGFWISRNIAATGEGNGSPLQYSCLKNSMDRGAWQAAVPGVAKSWIRQSDVHSLP